MKKVVNRAEAASTLEQILNNSKSNTIFLSGEPGSGKTNLINEVFKDHIVFKLSGKDYPTADEQIKATFEELYKRTAYREIKDLTQRNWALAFFFIECYLNEIESESGKKVLFFDDVHLLAPEGPTAHEFLFETSGLWYRNEEKRNDIITVLCGHETPYLAGKIYNTKTDIGKCFSHTINLQTLEQAQSDTVAK